MDMTEQGTAAARSHGNGAAPPPLKAPKMKAKRPRRPWEKQLERERYARAAFSKHPDWSLARVQQRLHAKFRRGVMLATLRRLKVEAQTAEEPPEPDRVNLGASLLRQPHARRVTAALAALRRAMDAEHFTMVQVEVLSDGGAVVHFRTAVTGFLTLGKP